jgi:hypothetical protein
MKRDDDFSTNIKIKLAERAAYICSRPYCNRFTIGPDGSNTSKSIKAGVASHICGASPGGARYDANQSSDDRKSISNAIWLCGSCSILIDKNGGDNYPPNQLRKWKIDHEQLISECLEGTKKIPIYTMTNANQSNTCRKIVKFLEQRGALFMDLKYEIPAYVFDSAKEIRTFLTEIQSVIIPDSPLEEIVDSINNACRYFMNTTNYSMNITELKDSLGAMRKIIGVNLLKMENIYGLNLTGSIRNIIPKQ